MKRKKVMELIKINEKVKCDMNGCENKADYCFDYKKNYRKSGIYLCEKCIAEMYKKIGQELIPKSPVNILNTEKRKKVNETKE